MKNRFGRFALVGTMVTIVDVAVEVGLVHRGLPVVVADLGALALAAMLSYSLHRWVTFADSPYVRWVHTPVAFITIAVVAGAVDLIVLLSLVVTFEVAAMNMVAAKLVAVAVAALVRGLAYRSLLWRVVRRDQDSPSAREPSGGDVRLSVIVPAYCEGEIIAHTLQRIRADLAKFDGEGDLELVVVDDGSIDDTSERARHDADVVERLDHNRGKGAAVRRGMQLASGRAVAFLDADLAYSPDQLIALVERIEQGWDVVVGSRRHDDTTTLVRAGRLREIGGRVINLLTWFVLLGQYRDTQCGLKAFRGDTARLLAERTRIDRFAFDVEIFHLVERYRLSLCEVQVRVENSTRSSVRVVRDAARMMMDLFRIRRWSARGVYSPTLSTVPPASVAGAATTTKDADVRS